MAVFLRSIDSTLPGMLRRTTTGYVYERDGRTYWFAETWSGNRALFDVEARVNGVPAWRRLDIGFVACCEAFAAEIAPEDAALRREVRRDLFFAWAEIMRVLQVLSEERLPRLVDLLIVGLEPEAALELGRRARRLGARVLERKSA